MIRERIEIVYGMPRSQSDFWIQLRRSHSLSPWPLLFVSFKAAGANLRVGAGQWSKSDEWKGNDLNDVS